MKSEKGIALILLVLIAATLITISIIGVKYIFQKDYFIL